jgi:hypothetical protein
MVHPDDVDRLLLEVDKYKHLTLPRKLQINFSPNPQP